MKREKNGFEKREELGPNYWQDDRWKKVKKLRIAHKDTEANGLVCEIRADWGLM